MTQPTTTEGTYSAETYDTARRMNKFLTWVKKLLMNKDMIPVEATALVRVINFLKALPVPQLKLLLLIVGIMIVVYCIVKASLGQ